MSYVVIVIDEDGTLTAFGPWESEIAEKRAAKVRAAFPRATVYVRMLLTVKDLEGGK